MPGFDFAHRLGWKAYIALVLEIVWDRFSFMWWRTETRSAEITFGLIAIVWALLLFRADTLAAKHLSNYLLQLAPAEVWQWSLVILGVGQIGISPLRQRSMILLRCAVWLFSFATWSYVMWISFLEVPPTLFTAAVAIVMAFGSVWATTRTVGG